MTNTQTKTGNNLSDQLGDVVDRFTSELQEGETGDHWERLGVALYYADRWDEANEAFEKAIAAKGSQEPTTKGGESVWWYVTMTKHQVGEPEKAREYYQQLVAQLDERGVAATAFHANNRKQAASVLGIDENED